MQACGDVGLQFRVSKVRVRDEEDRVGFRVSTFYFFHFRSQHLRILPITSKVPCVA